VKTQIINLDQLDKTSLVNFLENRGWELQPTNLKGVWIYEKKKEGNTYQVYLISPDFSDWEQRLEEALETVLAVEEITLPITIKLDKVFTSLLEVVGTIDVKDINNCLRC
jgi:hypothetical protein